MDNTKHEYHPEEYWSKVGERIESRAEENNVIAGDDEPFYRYKRKQFLNLLFGINFSGKTVLEIGCGPGGNLSEIIKLKPKKLVGCDISSQMVKLAKSKLPGSVEIIKINGTELPFNEKEFEIVFTATVLQHNTDEQMLIKIIKEICRVSSHKVFLFERIESQIKGDELCLGRPKEYYAELMNQFGFSLTSHKFINIRMSYYVSGAIRKALNPKTRLEGEPLTALSVFLQKLTLPITKYLDKIITSNKDVARLEFTRQI
ncbi:MAG TPA: class I SAM-dependent methyltransferase [Flavitalea sp.]|nr:class I SAM-dependent methyltransferase [Flavitalea sp.]